MKQNYLTLFLLTMTSLPMAAQNEVATIATSEKVILNGPITSKDISVCDTNINTFPIEVKPGSEVNLNNVPQGVSMVHFVDGSIGKDSRSFYSDGIAYLDAGEPIIIDALFVYPNPAKGMVQIKLPGKVSIQIYTLDGHLVSKYQLPPGNKSLNLSALSAGVYQIRAKSDEDYFSGKLLIQ
jgi:hypothetical protein